MTARRITYAEALVETLDELMTADPRVVLIGSYILGLSPRRYLLDGLRQRHRDRILDPPIAELGYVGVAIGAAMNGLRPIVDVATASFMFQAWPQIANEAGIAHYMSGGQTSVPLVVHMLSGIRGGGGAQHSVSPQAMLWNTPGLEIMLPSTPQDLKGLLRTAIASDNPTMFVDQTMLFEVVDDVTDDSAKLPFGRAAVRRRGRDITIVATSWMVHEALKAATRLAAEGIDAEVIDLRTLVPLDRDTLFASVRKTGRVVIADESQLSCGIADGISAILAEELFDALKAPIKRVAVPNVPIPYSEPLERALQPTPESIAAGARGIMRRA